MRAKIFMLFISLWVLKDCEADTDTMACVATYCADYISSNPCPVLDDQCTAQNSTFSGIITTGNSPCSCCQTCIINKDVGGNCVHDDSSGMVPNMICGDGLTCDEGTNKCVEMFNNTVCVINRSNYDSRKMDGVLGTLEIRPTCDADGFYVPYMCIPGRTCFCVDIDGNRLFGEVPYSDTVKYEMTCECSRKYALATQFLGLDDLNPDQFFRCSENGNYDTIQCIDDKCMCTDAEDGAPTVPLASSVNASLISNTTMSGCFKEGIHVTGGYHYPCALQYLQVLSDNTNYKTNDGYSKVFSDQFPNCTIDGRYGPVQKTNEYAYCADKNGTQIGSYQGPLEDIDSMNCYCATTSLLIQNALEQPDCCDNGNFNPVQCRRGTCYCVDENGAQVVTVGEVNEALVSQKETLYCYDPSSTCKIS